MPRIRRLSSRIRVLKEAMVLGNPPPWFSLAREAKSEKLPLPRSGHGALCLIHRESESFRDEARYALHHPLPPRSPLT